MLKKQRRQPIQPLYYRLYILYFESSPNILQSINKKAFYRVSVWYQEQQLADMMQGLNPTILADKIFLPNANIFFKHDKLPKVSLHLWYRFKDEDTILAKTDLDLVEFNKKFIQKGQQNFIKENLQFTLNNGSIKLVYDLFVERDKVELDNFIRKFKEEEQKRNKMKRIQSSRLKMSSAGDSLKRGLSIPTPQPSPPVSPQKMRKPPQMIKNQSKQSVINIDMTQDQNEEEEQMGPSPLQAAYRLKKEQKQYILTDQKPSISSKNNSSKLVHLDSNSSGKYLQINSAQLRTKAGNVDKLKAILQELEEKKVPSASSHISSQKQQHGKQFSMLVRTASVVSDGSEASQMMRNNSKQTYSQRAVARFKKRVFKCANTTLIILAIVMLYFLFVPSAKFSKLPRGSRGKVKKMKENWLQF